jgi:hypothetical protein
VLVKFPDVLPIRGPKKLATPFRFFFLGFALIWTVIAFAGTYRDYHAIRKTLDRNQVNIVEGKVTNFRPMPHSGHAMESFCVEGTCFEYSDYVVTSGFNNTASHGGPIREDLQVRISYIGNTIVRLEVQK